MIHDELAMGFGEECEGGSIGRSIRWQQELKKYSKMIGHIIKKHTHRVQPGSGSLHPLRTNSIPSFDTSVLLTQHNGAEAASPLSTHAHTRSESRKESKTQMVANWKRLHAECMQHLLFNRAICAQERNAAGD
jgi:hypothetical protein